MINKIKEQRESCKSQAAPNRNKHSRTKITKLLMHRLIQRIKAQDKLNSNSSFVIHNSTDDTSNSQSQPQRAFINIKKQAIKTEQSQPTFDSIFRKNYSNSRWEDNKESDSLENWKQFRSKNFKVVKSGKSSDFNMFISERMKRQQKKKQKDQINSQDSCDGSYFGLNVVQIKKIHLPKKQIKDKDYKDKYLNCKEKVQYSPQLGKQKKKVSYIDLGTQKMQAIDSVTDSMIQDHSLLFRQELLKGKKKLMTKTHKENSYKKKMLKMLECLDIIMNSYHCRLKIPEVQVTMKDQFCDLSNEMKTIKHREKIKYKYYIGSGNNCNLIRSLLRKRGWWSEVDHMNKANFVWTQLKIPAVLDKLQAHDDEDWVCETIFYEQINEEANLLSPTKQSAKKSISSTKQEVSQPKQSSLKQLFHDRQSRKYYSLLDSKESLLRLESLNTPHLVHNHFEHNYMFGNKNALYYNLSKYYQFIGKKIGDIVPLTFYLQKDCKSITNFQRTFNEMKKKETIWILKPAQNSNRGHGIEVTNSLQEIKLKLNNQKKLIVQLYVKNLLLYNYRKFDIRTYMIAVTIKGRMKFYWYEEGYIRTSSQLYDLDNLRDQLIHLTNDAIQKKGDNYGLYQEGNKLSYSQFQRYLEIKFPKETWKMTILHQKMKKIAQDSVRAAYCRLDPTRKMCSFELFGLDFMIDNQFKPYLIQINTNPCLQLCSGVLERMIPRMMENMFRLCVDPIFRPNPDNFYSKSQLYYMYDYTFLDRNKFTLIFDEKYDRNFQWYERCRSMRGLQWNLEDQEQYADDGKIIMVDY